MAFPSLMEALGLDSTSGRLLVPWEMILLIRSHFPLVAAAVMTPGHIRQASLAMTTSVTLAFMEAIILTMLFSPVTRCEMVLVVVAPAPAAHSTTLHGSARLSPSPPLTTWKRESVIAGKVGTHPSHSWKYMCNRMQLVITCS